MEHRSDQQPVTPGTITLPSSYAQPPHSATSAPAAPRPGRFRVIRTATRLVVRRLLYGGVLLGRALKPFAALLALLIVLLGVIGWMSFQLWWPRTAVQDTRVQALNPAPAVSSYIKGMQSYDADLVWEAYSTNFQAGQLEKGASKDTLQTALDGLRTTGIKFAQADYVGGVPIDGGNMYFYAVRLESAGQQQRVPMIFRVDGDGRITSVSPAPQ
ncbi:MAG TPA: hypothetical protein VFS21_10365 [Roseiflexaceae bacterium]|nr:hypothetical protein [Roseiflexaceae bacterium]